MRFNEITENFRGRRSYNDYDNNRTGFGRPSKDMSDEANLLYIYSDGRLKQKMISNHVEQEARAMGFRDSPEQALKMHGIIRSKFNPEKWVQKQGNGWTQVFPFGNPNEVAESATAGATSTASIGTVDAPHISPGKARGKKSYTGSPGSGSGTKAPPQPKIVQPKNSNGTAKNGLDIKGTSLFGGPANEAAVIKRR
jgi:hypothetical protein